MSSSDACYCAGIYVHTTSADDGAPRFSIADCKWIDKISGWNQAWRRRKKDPTFSGTCKTLQYSCTQEARLLPWLGVAWVTYLGGNSSPCVSSSLLPTLLQTPIYSYRTFYWLRPSLNKPSILPSVLHFARLMVPEHFLRNPLARGVKGLIWLTDHTANRIILHVGDQNNKSYGTQC